MNKRHAKSLKIKSTKYVLDYCVKLIGVATKQKNIFEGKKHAESFKINRCLLCSN